MKYSKTIILNLLRAHCCSTCVQHFTTHVTTHQHGTQVLRNLPFLSSVPRVTPRGNILCYTNMASVRQADTALWLHNKLSTDDSWSGSSLRSSLTQDVLRNIPECFHRLETQVKVKLLMAFLHLPRRVIEETNSEMNEIFEIGSQDEDEWVRVLSEILKYYPSTGMLNVHLEHVSPVFSEVAQEVRKTGTLYMYCIGTLIFYPHHP